MAIKEVHSRLVTCDRCRLEVQQGADAVTLPEGWLVCYLGPEPTGAYVPGAFREFCRTCANGVEVAMAPTERIRRKTYKVKFKAE